MSIHSPYCLTIAGFDPSGGAGLLADIKTFEQCSVYGLAACTAITIQTEDEFKSVTWIPFELIVSQAEILLKKYDVEFAKIGLVKNFDELNELLLCLRTSFPKVKFIWDPILKASAGFEFHSDIDQSILKSILQNIFLITPNESEARKLASEQNSLSATKILSTFSNVFIKSIYRNDQFGDLLLTRDNEEIFFQNKINAARKHGSGCVLSSAITAALALGNDLPSACESGRDYTAAFLGSAEGLLGFHTTNTEQHA